MLFFALLMLSVLFLQREEKGPSCCEERAGNASVADSSVVSQDILVI
jgi:hypothetical protein